MPENKLILYAVGSPMQSLLLSVQMACKTISNLVNRAGLAYGVTDRSTAKDDESYRTDGRYYSMKRLDQLSTRVLRNALRFTGNVHMVTPAANVEHEQPAEHQPGVLIASAIDSNYVACLDPLDGSGNADASICTGTVFGVFEQDQQGIDNVVVGGSDDSFEASEQEQLVQSVLQPAQNMKAAGYCLYSSATVLVFTLEKGKVMGFTLDPQINEFVLTHPDLSIPARGNVYSCNEANSEGWPEGFRDYLRGQQPERHEVRPPLCGFHGGRHSPHPPVRGHLLLPRRYPPASAGKPTTPLQDGTHVLCGQPSGGKSH